MTPVFSMCRLQCKDHQFFQLLGNGTSQTIIILKLYVSHITGTTRQKPNPYTTPLLHLWTFCQTGTNLFDQKISGRRKKILHSLETLSEKSIKNFDV